MHFLHQPMDNIINNNINILIFVSILYITFHLLYNNLYYNVHILALVKIILLFCNILACIIMYNI